MPQCTAGRVQPNGRASAPIQRMANRPRTRDDHVVGSVARTEMLVRDQTMVLVKARGVAPQERDSGATAVEYVLLVVAIALVMLVGVFTLGRSLQARFTNTASCVSTISASSPHCS